MGVMKSVPYRLTKVVSIGTGTCTSTPFQSYIAVDVAFALFGFSLLGLVLFLQRRKAL